jgi:hypothetical protein
MLDDAGFDGDAPDFAKAARGFLIHDAANPVLRSSYKLPFADIVGGELKAIKSGVALPRAASTNPMRPLPCATRPSHRNCRRATSRKPISAGRNNWRSHRVARPRKNPGAISSANEAAVGKAMDHHESATKCIKDVLASNALTDDPDGDNDDPRSSS